MGELNGINDFCFRDREVPSEKQYRLQKVVPMLKLYRLCHN